jgi:hypothetical protein
MCHSASQSSSAPKTERQFILGDGGSEEAWIVFKINIRETEKIHSALALFDAATIFVLILSNSVSRMQR